VVTDFDVHPFWVNEGTYRYVVASEYTKERLKAQGIDEARILVFGIPVDPKFLLEQNKDALREKFHLAKDKGVVLVITGSFGLGPLEEIADLLHGETQVLVVCARNKKLYARLIAKAYPSVRVFGFINNVEELMSVADIIITKPGGLTVSEVLAMELAPIFVYAIPGQETKNLKVLESFGIGVRASCIKEVKRIVLGYKANPAGLRQVKEKIRIFKKSNPLEGIYNVVCESSLGAAG